MKTTNLILLLAGLLVLIITSSRADVLDNWTTNQITTNSFELHHVVYGNGCYMAVAEYADGGEIYSSEDGLNWTLRFSDNNSWGLTLNYSRGHFSGVGGFGIADVSADGTNWTSTFLPLFDDYAGQPYGQAITYGNGLYVTVGDTNGVGTIQTSPDGVTWTSRSISPAPGGRIASVVYAGNRFLAVGNNDGLVYVSSGLSAGTTWTRYSIPGGNKIIYGGGLFLVPLNNKTNLVSADGINWSLNPTGLTNMLGAVTYSHGLFIAQCGISISGSYLATSTDCTNWIQYPKPLPNSWSAFDSTDFDVSLATDGTRLVAVGAIGAYPANSFIYTSDVLVGVRMTNAPSRQVALSGLIGRNYQIQSADTLNTGANNWRTNASVQLTKTPFVWADSTTTNSARFYRGVLMP
jgi:hypothetical protein